MSIRTHAVRPAALVIAIVFLTAALPAAAADRRPLDRKIRVMEKVIDAVLLDSPNVVVSRNATRGLELEGFGALFTFEANLNLAGIHGGGVGVGVGVGNVYFGDTERFLVQTHGSDGDEASPHGKDKDKVKMKSREEIAQASQDMLDALRVELIDTLVDYGATLAELDDTNWVAIAAFVDGNRFFTSPDAESRLLLKVKMRDLRSFAAGRLNRQELASMVEVNAR